MKNIRQIKVIYTIAVIKVVMKYLIKESWMKVKLPKWKDTLKYNIQNDGKICMGPGGTRNNEYHVCVQMNSVEVKIINRLAERISLKQK